MKPCDLKRQQLADKFSEIVKQEIRNHNASILETNKAINDIRSQLQTLTNKFSENLVKQEAARRKFEKELHSLSDKFEHNKLEISTKFDRVKSDLEDLRHDVSRNLEALESETVSLSSFEEFRETCDRSLREMSIEIQKQKDFNHAAVFKINNDMNRIFNDFVEDQENRPNELWDVKADLEKKIFEAVIDSTGVLKEMRVVKKDAFIMEKKIENLYSLIEKLKGKK